MASEAWFNIKVNLEKSSRLSINRLIDGVAWHLNVNLVKM